MAKRMRIVVLVLVVLAGVTSLVAAPDHEILIEYYTDGTYTEQCGFKYYNCTGQWQREGCVTAYYIGYDGHDC
jgi:hypothetical protein